MKTIKIRKEFQIPGTNVILEKGDKIRVLEANYEFAITAKESGDIIDYAKNYDEAYRMLKNFERSDKKDGIYQDEFYQIVPLNDRGQLDWDELEVYLKQNIIMS